MAYFCIRWLLGSRFIRALPVIVQGVTVSDVLETMTCREGFALASCRMDYRLDYVDIVKSLQNNYSICQQLYYVLGLLQVKFCKV
jgi:hypothetical protein